MAQYLKSLENCTWRQKGDYDDLFDFDKDKVLPYFEPVKRLITLVEEKIDASKWN